MKRFVMNIPDELHKKLKVIAALEGKDMTDIVRRLIAGYVERAEKRKLIPVSKTNT